MNILYLLPLLVTAILITSPATQGSCRHPIEGHPRGNLTLKKRGCTPKTVPVKVCEGECSSMCFPHYHHGEIVTTTACFGCRPKEMALKHETLECGTKTKTVTYMEAVQCECDPIGKCFVGMKKRRSVTGIQGMRPVRAIVPTLTSKY
jgi:hypothetical protein